MKVQSIFFAIALITCVGSAQAARVGVPVDRGGAPCGSAKPTRGANDDWSYFEVTNSCSESIRIVFRCSGDRGNKSEHIGPGRREKVMCLRKAGGDLDAYHFEWF